MEQKFQAEKILPSLILIEKMVGIAGLAPSPENNQPWLFEVGADHLQLRYVKARAIASDPKHLLNFISLGAALENLRLAAETEGYSVRIAYQPLLKELESQPLPLVAKIYFSLSLTPTSSLLPFAISRFTDRSVYSRKPLEEGFLKELDLLNDPRVQVTIEKARLKIWAKAIKALDKTRFEKKLFHSELHRSLRYTLDEVESTRDGLDIRTLGLPAGASGILKLLSSWTLSKCLNLIGLASFFSAITEKQILSSAGLVIVTAKDYSLQSCLEVGILFQRACLISEKHQISFQPYAHFAIFNNFSDRPADILIKPFLNADQVPVMALRLGYSQTTRPPKTLRYPLKAILKYES